MARDTPGARRFAAQRSTLARTAPPARSRIATSAAERPRAASRRLAPPDWPSDVRAAVQARSGGRCEARCDILCTGYGEHLHHRLLRRHGDHTAANALAVCHACHQAIHAHPAAAYAHGLMVRAGGTPATTPVVAGRPIRD